VYCPIEGKLVYLTEVTGDWNDDDEAYIGGDMNPILAKKIALGDADPITGLPMEDINPSFIPRVLKPLPVIANSPSQSTKNKGKKRESLPTSGILSFFGPNPIIPPRTKQSTPPIVHKQSLSGKASGKRRLAEVMDYDRAQRKRHRKSSSPSRSIQSKFFHTPSESKVCGIQRRHSDGIIAAASSSKLQDKENRYIIVDDDDDDEVAETYEPDLDGSISDEEVYLAVDVEAISSPVSARKSPFFGIHETPTKRNAYDDDDDDDVGYILDTPSPTKVQYPADEIPSPILYAISRFGMKFR